MARKGRARRRFLVGAGAVGLTAFAMPYIKTARSAGKLSIGTWDHWVPGANEVLREICEQWGADNGIEVNVDFITSIGNKLLLTAQAESRAKTGHDVFVQPLWFPSMFRHRLEPVDDVVEDIISEHGALHPSK